MSWPEERLAALDLAVMNLACAAGLPDAGDIDAHACLRRLDEMAEYTRQFTAQGLPKFRQRPAEYNHSEGYYRILCMVTALQRDLGLRYNPKKIPLEVPLDTADTFIHGALLGEGGTCASLPVVYVAVGRRLGYPLKLVSARSVKLNISHLFARWDDPKGERFNIEATSPGLNCYPDDFYRTGIYALEPGIEEKACLLQSKTPQEELAGFLTARAFRWRDLGNWGETANSLAWAASVAPHNASHLYTFQVMLHQWNAEQAKRKPPEGFPRLYFTWPPRRFPEAFPLKEEKDRLCLEATENLLTHPEWDARLWEPMRRGTYSGRKLTRAEVVCTPDGGSTITLRFEEPPPYSYGEE